MLFDVDIPSDSDSSSDTTSKYQQLQEEQEMKDILLCSMELIRDYVMWYKLL